MAKSLQQRARELDDEKKRVKQVSNSAYEEAETLSKEVDVFASDVRQQNIQTHNSGTEVDITRSGTTKGMSVKFVADLEAMKVRYIVSTEAYQDKKMDRDEMLAEVIFFITPQARPR